LRPRRGEAPPDAVLDDNASAQLDARDYLFATLSISAGGSGLG
jgi:hypothetical protein